MTGRCRIFWIERKGQTPRIDVFRHQKVKTGLIDRHFATFEHLNLARVFIDADNLMSEIGKANPRNQPNIAGADHRNLHMLMPSCTV